MAVATRGHKGKAYQSRTCSCSLVGSKCQRSRGNYIYRQYARKNNRQGRESSSHNAVPSPSPCIAIPIGSECHHRHGPKTVRSEFWVQNPEI